MIFDSEAGRRRVVHALIFTAVYSRHMFVWLTFTQTLESIIAGCEAAWRFFGGVFKVLIPDNMKPIVAKADATNPRFTVGWLEYAQSRGFITDPTRVASPQDKPRVERGVQYVRGNFFAAEQFVDLADAQVRAEAWCREKAGLRIHGTTCAQPAVVFVQHEAPALLPAPERVYRVPVYVDVKVHRDYHVQIDRALYSVPEHLLGQRVSARADEELVKLFYRGQLVKTHPRQPAGGRSTDPVDLPAENRLRHARCGTAGGHRRRARRQRGHLRRTPARPRAALDQDAPGLPGCCPWSNATAPRPPTPRVGGRWTSTSSRWPRSPPCWRKPPRTPRHRRRGRPAA